MYDPILGVAAVMVGRVLVAAPVSLAVPTAVWINKPTAPFDAMLAVGAEEVTTHCIQTTVVSDSLARSGVPAAAACDV